MAAIRASRSTPRGVLAWLKQAMVGTSPWLKAPKVGCVSLMGGLLSRSGGIVAPVLDRCQGGPALTPGCWVSSRLPPGFRCRAGAGTRRLSGPPRWLERGKFFGRGAALQSEGEAFIVVPGLPAPQGGGRRLEVREALPAPELLLIDPMAPFDLAVLLRPAGSDIPVADPGGFDPQHKGEGEILALITPQALDWGRGSRSELGQEGEARAVM